MRSLIVRLLLTGSIGAAGCAEMGPALTQAVVAVGRDFIGQTAANYAPDYAESVNQLLLTMAEITTGAPFTSGVDGYQAHTVYEDPNPVFSQSYDQSYVGQTSEGIHDDSTAYGDAGAGPVGDSYPEAVSAPDYGAPADSGVQQRLVLVADLLAQSFSPDGRVKLRLIEDGDVLVDGRGNPSAGDKFKLRYQANCDCYLYIIGVDATGWVTQILPEAGQGAQPMTAGQTQLIPAGEEWWGLDEYRGVEHVYFILSEVRRTDLEEKLSVLPVERPSPGSGYATVEEPTVLATRGLVKVTGQAPEASAIATADQPPDSAFSTELLTGDLVITRWFQHQ